MPAHLCQLPPTVTADLDAPQKIFSASGPQEEGQLSSHSTTAGGTRKGRALRSGTSMSARFSKDSPAGTCTTRIIIYLSSVASSSAMLFNSSRALGPQRTAYSASDTYSQSSSPLSRARRHTLHLRCHIHAGPCGEDAPNALTF